MKAHQNRNMTYDDMNDYVMSMELRNLREVTYCHYFNHIGNVHVLIWA